MKDLKKFIKTTIREYLNESLNNNLQYLISEIGNKYSKENNKTLQQLNNGDCEDIAHDLIEKIGGETINTFIIDDGWFWDSDEISEYKTQGGDYWNVDNLIKYGNPPFDWKYLERLDLKGHVWIYSDGKHYDVETVNGVDNFWELPIYQRQLANLNLI